MGVSSPDGMELLIHVGVDTVAMNGDGFECFVQEGQQVKAGDKLIAFDREKIAAAGHPDVVVVLVTNSDEYVLVAKHPGQGKGDADGNGCHDDVVDGVIKTEQQAANMAQGAATLAVALKTKNGKTKSVALPSAFSCCP